jgi:integrase
MDGYRTDAERLAGLGTVRLRDLTPVMISDHYKTLKVAPKTVRNTHGTVHKALSDAVKRGVLARNPADHVELPRAERPDTQTWAADELRRFLIHVEGIDWRAPGCWSLPRECGGRRSLA